MLSGVCLSFVNVLDNEGGGAEWERDGAHLCVTNKFVGCVGMTFG